MFIWSIQIIHTLSLKVVILFVSSLVHIVHSIFLDQLICPCILYAGWHVLYNHRGWFFSSSDFGFIKEVEISAAVPFEIVFSVLRFELNWNRFLTIQRRGLNSLNSALVHFRTQKRNHLYIDWLLLTFHLFYPISGYILTFAIFWNKKKYIFSFNQIHSYLCERF